MLTHTFHTWEPGQLDLSDDNKITVAGITIVGDICQQVREALLSEVNRVYTEHGPHAFESTQQAAAIHEAGHATIAPLVGRRLMYVTIAQNGPGWLGYTECHGSVDLSTPEGIIKYSRFVLAGQVAERMFDPDFREGSSLDEVVMSQVLATQTANFTSVEDQRRCWSEQVYHPVWECLKRHHLITQEIANHLLEHHDLRGRDLIKIIKPLRREARGGAPRCPWVPRLPRSTQ